MELMKEQTAAGASVQGAYSSIPYGKRRAICV